MSSFISVPLAIMAWIFTFFRLRVILRQGLQEVGVVALHIWGMLFFFSISFTFIIVEFISFFDSHTLPSLSLLITNAAFLISQYFGMVGIIAGIGELPFRRVTRFLKLLLIAELIALLFFYILFVSKVQTNSFFIPRSLPEAIFIVMVSLFAIIMCIILVTTQLIYFPSKKFVLMRLRTVLISLCVFVSAIFLATRVVLFGSYIWSFSTPEILIPISYILLICTTLLFFAAHLSGRIYARFLLLSRRFDHWRAFQDLQHLIQQMTTLFPPVGLRPTKPGFWQFIINPEAHLYRAVIVILDGRALMQDFLREYAPRAAEREDWEDEEGDYLVQEIQAFHQRLQTVNPPDDFYEIVAAYRSFSKTLSLQQAQE